MSLRFLHPKKRKSISLIGKLIGFIESKPTSDRLILRILFFTITGSLLSAAIIWGVGFTNLTPVAGGTLTEGIIGTPRFVNPALAVTRADLDVTALIYSGLMKINPEGVLVPDLAESITVSDDGKTYNVIIKKDLRFHDNTPLTARDVAFTISLIQNAELKSPLRGNWVGVTVEEINEYELNIVLEEAYAPFIENFTVGILPRAVWSELPIEQVPFSQHNTEPVGSGPFKIDDIVRSDAGLISAYKLTAFTANQPVKLDGLDISFFANEADLTTAFEQKEIMSTVYLPAAYARGLASSSDYKIVEEALPRVFGVFFNQNKSPALRDTGVRLALAAAVDRKELIDSALAGFGVPTLTPMPESVSAVPSGSQMIVADVPPTIENATTLLTKAGWIKNNNGGWEKRIDGTVEPLKITLRTANTPLFDATSEIVARRWRELGADVQVEKFEQSDLLQAVIRPRDFEGLLFGLDMSRAVDLYPFWHSSQREDPGLNVAKYANIEVDTLLARARTASSSAVQKDSTAAAVAIINREAPATFLFVPSLAYVLDNRIYQSPMNAISKPHERFMNIGTWHMNTDRLWPFFNTGN